MKIFAAKKVEHVDLPRLHRAVPSFLLLQISRRRLGEYKPIVNEPKTKWLKAWNYRAWGDQLRYLKF